MPSTSGTPRPPERSDELEVLKNELWNLKRALLASEARYRAALQEHEARLAVLQAQTQSVERMTRSVIASRTWQTLITIGGWVLRLARRGQKPPEQPADHPARETREYQDWIKATETRNADWIDSRTYLFARKPLITVVLEGEPEPELVERAISSVRAQSYPDWELLVVTKGSPSECSSDFLPSEARPDPRIRYVQPALGSAAENPLRAILHAAAGDYIGFLRSSDTLSPHALFDVVDTCNHRPEADLIYSDRDDLDRDGNRRNPFFKPDWSPELLLSFDYLFGWMVFRRSLAVTEEHLTGGSGNAGHHDLALRLSSRAGSIVHVPRILYHSGAVLKAVEVASAEVADGIRVVEGILRDRGVEGRVEATDQPGRLRVRYTLQGNPKVRILIPTAGNLTVLGHVLNAIARNTKYRDYAITVIDNSRGAAVREFTQRRSVEWFDCRNQPFNFSRINNTAARACRDNLLLFLNDDTAPIAPEWMDSLVELATRPDVGAVGAKLLYPDRTIQHAGVLVGIHGACDHAFRHLPADTRCNHGLANVSREVSAVTGACLMVPAHRFHEVGGFDECDLPVAFQDVDLCLKLRAHGYRVLYTPFAELYHYESLSKKGAARLPDEGEVRVLQSRWPEVIGHDPYYNINLSRERDDFGVGAWPCRIW